MAERRPIVLVDGELQELPQGDTTPGSGGGGGGSGDPLAFGEYRMSAVQTGFNLNVEQKIAFDTESIALSGLTFSAVNNNWTATKTATYLIFVQARVNAGSSADGSLAIQVKKNGTDVNLINRDYHSTTWGVVTQELVMVSVVDTDVIEIFAETGDGAPNGMQMNQDHTSVKIMDMTGSAAGGGSTPTVGFRYERITSTQSIPSATTTTLIMNGQIHDNLAGYDDSTGIWTVPAEYDGQFVYLTGQFWSNGFTTENIDVVIQKDGSAIANNRVSSTHSLGVATVAKVATGEEYRLAVYTDSSSTLGVDQRSHFSATVIGGGSGAGGSTNTILNGTVDPTTEGEDGDFYINTTSNTIFGPKATTWPAGVSIVGPAGTNGTNGTDGADGAPGSAGLFSYHSPNTGTSGTSSSAFATKGVAIRMKQTADLKSVTFDISASATQTVDICVARLTGPSGTIDQIEHAVGTLAQVDPASGTVFTFPTPLRLLKDVNYAIMFVRTDSATTSPLSLSFPASAAVNDPQFFWEVPDSTSGVRYASVDPQIGDSPVDNALSGPVKMYLDFSMEFRLPPIGGTTGQALIKASDSDYDFTFGDVAAGGGGGPATNLKYARASLAADSVGLNLESALLIPWDTEDVDEGGWWEGVTNPSRMTVPAAVTKAKVKASVRINNIVAGVNVFLEIYKNGAQMDPRIQSNEETSGTTRILTIETPILTVAPTDYFEARVINSSGDTSVDIESANSYFQIEEVPLVGGAGAAPGDRLGFAKSTTVETGVVTSRQAINIPSVNAEQANGDYLLQSIGATQAAWAGFDIDGSGDFDVVMKTANQLADDNFTANGIWVSDGTEYNCIAWFHDGLLYEQFWTGTSFQSEASIYDFIEKIFGGITYWRVKKTGTTLEWYVSPTGLDWTLVKSDTTSESGLTFNNITSMGIYINANASVGPGAYNINRLVGLDLDGPQAEANASGPPGDTGPAGAAGQGVPAGGTTGQKLVKIDGTDYNTQWVDDDAGSVDANAARYWRARGTVAGSYNGGALADIDFQNAAGVSLLGGGTPSAGSEDFGGTAAGAFDQNTGTMWAGEGNAVALGTSWVAYDFGPNNEQTVERVVITARSSSNSNQVWDEWVLEWSSDGILWNTLETISDATAWASNEQKTYDISARKGDSEIVHKGQFRSGTNGGGALDGGMAAADADETIVVLYVGQHSGTPTDLTISGVSGTQLGSTKVGSFDVAQAYYWPKGTLGNLAGETIDIVGGSTFYRSSFFIFGLKKVDEDSLAAVLDTTVAASALQVSSLNEGGIALGAYTTSGAAPTITGDLDQVGSAANNLEDTFYSGSQYGNVPADGIVDFGVDDVGSNDRTVSVMVTANPASRGATDFTFEEKEKLAALDEFTQDEIDAATYSTVNSDFTGGKFKMVRQACTITIEPGATNKKPITFVPTGAGMITFAAGSGVTIISPDSLLSTRVTGSPVTLVQDRFNVDTYILMGDLA